VNELIGGFRRRAIEQRTAAHRSGDGEAAERMEALVSERDAMRRVLLSLPVGQRAVLALRFYEDLTETETAAVLGVSLGTVKSRTSRAMTRLKGLLDEENIDA
jgi:RNA polymerase sigma-70 factor (ECF subfamily)